MATSRITSTKTPTYSRVYFNDFDACSVDDMCGISFKSEIGFEEIKILQNLVITDVTSISK